MYGFADKSTHWVFHSNNTIELHNVGMIKPSHNAECWAASCMNRSLSFSDEPGFRILTATSFVVQRWTIQPCTHCQIHLIQLLSVIWHKSTHNLWQSYIFKKHPWTIFKINNYNKILKLKFNVVMKVALFMTLFNVYIR